MQRKSTSRILLAATSIIITFALASPSAMAQVDTETERSRDRGCSDRTLQGNYGFAVEGTLLASPDVALQGRGVAMTHFDGKGNLKQVDSLLINGSPISDWSPVTGTYHVNANCTGTMNLLPSTGGFVNLRIVVVRHGEEVHTVVWPPFDGPPRNVTSVGIKVD